MTKSCPNCGKDFQPNHGKQKFCSDKCKVASSRKNKSADKELAKPLLADIEDRYKVKIAELEVENRKLRSEIEALKAAAIILQSKGKVEVNNLTKNKNTNYSINTKGLSTKQLEIRKSKLGF